METAARGIVTPEKGECRYAIFGDIDNDGDPDLFVGVLYGDHLLFRNDGTGKFTRVDAAKAGIPCPGNTTGACFADFDGDGDLDLYIVNGENLMVKEPSPVYHAQNGHANQLLLNQGDWIFTAAWAFWNMRGY